MGTCFGRYSCSCCNCLYLKQPWSSSTPTTRSSVMARQSSTLEFENFMYECDLQEPSTLKLQQHPITNYHQQPSVSTVVRFDSHNVKLDNFKLPVYSDKYDGKLMISCDNYDKRRGESPLLDPILLNINERIASTSASSSASLSRSVVTVGSVVGGKGHPQVKSVVNNSKNLMMMMVGMRRQRRKEEINCSNLSGKINSDSDDSDTLVGSSSTINQLDHHQHQPMMMTTINSKVDNDLDDDQSTANCWDHEVNSDGLINGAGNDLEWDDYQDNLIFTDETDSLIQDIEDLTAKALKETGLN